MRKVPWSKILSSDDFSIWKIKVYYFTYGVSNNLFDSDKIDYFGLQAYFFEPNSIYAINYLTSSKDKLKNFVTLIKEVKSIK